MSKKKSFKPVKFQAKVDGKLTVFAIVKPSVIVPGFGKFKAEQLMEENERAQLALAKLIERKSGVLAIVSSDNAAAEKLAAQKAAVEKEDTKKGGK